MADKQQPKADRGWGQKEGFELWLDMQGQSSGIQRKTAQARITNVGQKEGFELWLDQWDWHSTIMKPECVQLTVGIQCDGVL